MSNDHKSEGPSQEEIAALAHQFYLERGGVHGFHEEDWYRAERELYRRRGIPFASEPKGDRTVVGLFHQVQDARDAFDDLLRAGFSRDDISFIANKAGMGADRLPDTGAGSDVAVDAGVGAALGGVGGLLLSFAALAVPGVGPVFVAGPILAALGGAGIGAAAGGIIGAFTERGVPEERARQYAEGVRRGDVLIAIHTEPARSSEAARILDQHGAIDIDDRVSAWRSRGWTDYDPMGSPLTADELRREREYYNAAKQQGAEWAKQSRATVKSGLAGEEAGNAKVDAVRTSRKAKETIGAGRNDVEGKDLPSTTGAAKTYQR
jgi:Protein of unknown function (DUF2934)